ncbi:RNA methyltransferase TrmH, group 1 [Candidatus Magnetomorum sp. HK-1]|nr:RNA methyltransferase TrmH, group 1 [Candidatus Magnetomorum sp. HK-1]
MIDAYVSKILTKMKIPGIILKIQSRNKQSKYIIRSFLIMKKSLYRVNLKNIAIVLNTPRFPENIGSAARAMCNMGINRLIVVKPKDCDLKKVLKLATHAAYDVVEDIIVYDNLEEALSPFQYVVATTARLGGYRVSVQSPRECAKKLINISHQNDIAIVFGPEDRGLMNQEIKLCHALVNIPTAEFSSLNVSQAVMVICYELFTATLEEVKAFRPRLANHYELEAMYKRLQEVLTRIDFIHHENPEHWMNNIRRFFNRLNLRSRDTRIILGICRQMDWYVNQQKKSKGE